MRAPAIAPTTTALSRVLVLLRLVLASASDVLRVGQLGADSKCDLQLFNDTSCTAAAFAWTNAASFSACCADCAAAPTCLACEYVAKLAGQPKACHLKAEPGPHIAQPGTTCGVSRSIPPPPPPRYTPCSYSVLHDLGAPAALHLPTPPSASRSMYFAQAACDAEPACGGWSVVAGKAALVRPVPPGGTVAAPTGSLLYVKNCGPWVDPPRPTVWPLPASVSSGNATAVLSRSFNLTSDASNRPSALLGRALERCAELVFTHALSPAKATGGAMSSASSLSMPASPSSPLSSAPSELAGLRLTVTGNGSEELVLGVDESYVLTVPDSASAGCKAPCVATLHCATVYGCVRGLETFAQLVRFDFGAGAYVVPSSPVVVSDAPRFAWRGVMIDVARHFMPVAVLRQAVDAMAFAKFNVLHLHLTDDQSFPVVSDAHPELAAAGAFSPVEKYTVGDIAALAAYARDRGVLVVPELDAPGHASAWCAGIPGLCPSPTCSTPMDPSAKATFDVIEALTREVEAACGSGLYHGGGDEVTYDCWQNTPHVRAWMQRRGFSSPQQAYSYFTAEVAARAAPATPVFWQDAFERAEPGTPLPSNSIVQFYKAGNVSAAAASHRVVFANNAKWGLDIHTSAKTWDSFYAVDPEAELGAVPAGRGAGGFGGSTNASGGDGGPGLIGGEACVWTVTFDASVLATAMWPRLLAVSEKLWSPAAATQNATASAALQRLVWARCALNARGVPAGSVVGNHVPDASPIYGSCLLQ